MSQEQAAAAVIIALTSESREKRQKIKVGMKLCPKRRKNFGFYETLLAKLRFFFFNFTFRLFYFCFIF